MPTYKQLTKAEQTVLAGILRVKLGDTDAIRAWLTENNADRSLPQWVNMAMALKSRPLVEETVFDVTFDRGEEKTPLEEQT
jgi:hypothetical protein